MKASRPKSKALGTNPKDLYAAKKISISKLPVIAVHHGAHAMMNGSDKYGPYNWRDKAVIASIYVDAAHRHLDAWFEGQKRATDSKVHHLGHLIACAAILLDAEYTGQLIDDRPLKKDGTPYIDIDKLMQEFTEAIQEMRGLRPNRTKELKEEEAKKVAHPHKVVRLEELRKKGK